MNILPVSSDIDLWILQGSKEELKAFIEYCYLINHNYFKEYVDTFWRYKNISKDWAEGYIELKQLYLYKSDVVIAKEFIEIYNDTSEI